MSLWVALQRSVAEPRAARLAAQPMTGGILVSLEVSFHVYEWPWDQFGAVSLVPQPVELKARTSQGECLLGLAIPSSGQVVTPMEHSSTASIRFGIPLSMHAISVLEALRDGGFLEVATDLVAHPHLAHAHSDTPIYPTTTQLHHEVPREEWLECLRVGGYCETLVSEVKIPDEGPPRTSAARARFCKAVGARDQGEYAETMRRCRIALNELENAGFGGKAPKDVIAFLKDNAGKLTQAERYSALKVAVELYLSPAHHANAPEEHYSRKDADLALAMTANLLELAVSRGGSSDE